MSPPINVELLHTIKRHAEAGHALIEIHHVTAAGDCSCCGKRCWEPKNRSYSGKSAAKHPRRNDWQRVADDPLVLFDRVKRGELLNVGLRLGPQYGGLQIIAIDIDDPNKFRSAFAAAQVLPDTLTQRTPSGGLHLIYSVADSGLFRNTVRPGDFGFDVRSQGGQIVLAGSHTLRGVYSVALDVPIAELPVATQQAILDAQQSTRPSAARARRPLRATILPGAGSDWDHWIARLRVPGFGAVMQVPPAVSGNNGQGTLMRAIAAARGWGLTRAEALDALRQWDAQKNKSDPWFADEAEVERKMDECSETAHGVFAFDAEEMMSERHWHNTGARVNFHTTGWQTYKPWR